MRVLSDEYKRVLVEAHAAAKHKWGGGGKYWWQIVTDFGAELECNSILDYGCGQGVLKEMLRTRCNVPIYEYDPGIVGKDTPPKPADLVVCTDVLEHVEPEYVDATLKHLRSLARIGLFAVISCGRAELTLSDGRNAHLSVHPAEWWLNRLQSEGFIIERTNTNKGLRVWATV